jgi:putative oxygen-independent coproporphyrinogen III oxidase
MNALEHELKMIDLAAGSCLETLYLGGGTPSQVPPDRLAAFLERLTSRFPFAVGAEVTAEANPEDVSPALLQRWSAVGINRLSMGVQSFLPGELELLDRRHTADTAERSARLVLEHGGFQVSLDLMLAIPRQSRTSLRRSLAKMLELRPHHLSVYLLEMDKPHRLQALARRHPEGFASDEEAAELYLLVHETLCAAGYEHYEISNFALPGHAAQHNTRYWLHLAVHALGVAAHGHDGNRRWANLENLDAYLLAIEQGTRPLAWSTILKPNELLAEDVLLGLRLARGVACDRVAEAASVFPSFAAKLEDFLSLGLAERAENSVRLAPRGWLLSNELFRELV